MLIRRLPRPDRPRYARHLKRLSEEDRRRRFGRAGIEDGWIDAHVAGLSEDDLILAACRGDEVIAAAHLALDPTSFIAEVGLSVDEDQRAGGLGADLLRQAAVFARNRGAGQLMTLCLSDNRAMVALARRAGMAVAFHPGEAEARLELDPPDALTLGQEMSTGLFAVFEDWAGLIERYHGLIAAAAQGAAPPPGGAKG
ncbi:GNAT family N-acetyltransferase [Phaeospirillum tilakii]|uniref:GNAT family N-acetyltransferase n=1 Tax=Phaeospirillum tilakii TaxID=741673 RepID=A0ABW5C9L3_9PROT